MPFGEEETDAAYVRALNLEFFRTLCAYGETYGVIICVENMPFGKQQLARVAPLLEFVKEVDSPWLRVCLDTGHCACLGDDPIEAVRLLGDKLAVLHVHDNDGKGDRHWFPGLGIIDWEAFMHALVEIGFEGALSLEVGYRYFKELERDEYFAKISETAKRLHSYIE
jgi:sugar phosphate isomerase/epimerase